MKICAPFASAETDPRPRPSSAPSESASPGLTVIHFDAHPDLYDELEGTACAHACPFASSWKGSGQRLIQVDCIINSHQREQA